MYNTLRVKLYPRFIMKIITNIYANFTKSSKLNFANQKILYYSLITNQLSNNERTYTFIKNKKNINSICFF